MAEQQREAFKALEQIEAVAGWTTTEEIERLTAIVRAALSHAEGEAVDLEIGAGDVLICDLGTASAAGVAFYRDNAAHDVGTHHPELSGMGGTELAGRIFSVMTEKPESLVVLYNAVGRALATLGHPAPHAEGEAFGWFTEDHDTDKSATTYDPVVADRWRKKGWPVWPLYTHPAPQVAGLTETAIKSSPAYRALHREKEHLLGLLKDQAPQVAVPEAVKERVVEAIAEALGDAKDCIRVWTAWGVGTMGPDDFLDVAEDPDRLDEIAEAAITAMFTAAPTAPAGESDDSDICERVELPHVLAWADGVRGDMRTEYADRITDEEARVAQAVWAAHTGEQPVSDPDGLTEPGRREAEQAYINCAFDYARDPIGSRDWVLFWNGWRARNAAPTAPAGELRPDCSVCGDFGSDCDVCGAPSQQLVSDSDGLPEPPFDAAHDARVFADRVEMKYGVRCQAGDIADCYEWQQLRQCLAAMAEYVDLATDERDIAALLERIVPRIDPQNPKPLDKSEHCCECTLYYERERIHDEIARLRKLGGNHD